MKDIYDIEILKFPTPNYKSGFEIRNRLQENNFGSQLLIDRKYFGKTNCVKQNLMSIQI